MMKMFNKEAIKQCLCHEIKKCLNSDDRVPPSGLKSLRRTYLVDVMAHIRKMRFKDLRTYVDLCSIFLNMLIDIWKNEASKDITFDS